MSIPFSGTVGRSGGVVSAIGKHLKSVNLKPVKRVTVTFDPFHENASATRDFLYFISSAKLSLTNPSCLIKSDVVCDRSAPRIKFTLSPEAAEQAKVQSVTLKADNLTTLELIQLCNKHVSTLAAKDEVLATVTKLDKKSAPGIKRGKK